MGSGWWYMQDCKRVSLRLIKTWTKGVWDWQTCKLGYDRKVCSFMLWSEILSCVNTILHNITQSPCLDNITGKLETKIGKIIDIGISIINLLILLMGKMENETKNKLQQINNYYDDTTAAKWWTYEPGRSDRDAIAIFRSIAVAVSDNKIGDSVHSVTIRWFIITVYYHASMCSDKSR